MDLTPLMKPKSIAVVGASPRMNRGTRVIGNLQHFGYGGRIFPINPKYAEILGLPCYPDLASTPEPAETVVVAIPASEVPGVLAAAVESGVRGAVILSSGFAEGRACGSAPRGPDATMVSNEGPLAPKRRIRYSISAASSISRTPGFTSGRTSWRTVLAKRAASRIVQISSGSLISRSCSTQSGVATHRVWRPETAAS